MYASIFEPIFQKGGRELSGAIEEYLIPLILFVREMADLCAAIWGWFISMKPVVDGTSGWWHTEVQLWWQRVSSQPSLKALFCYIQYLILTSACNMVRRWRDLPGALETHCLLLAAGLAVQAGASFSVKHTVQVNWLFIKEKCHDLALSHLLCSQTPAICVLSAV